MAAAAILKNRKIVISQQQFGESPQFGMMTHFDPLDPSVP